MTYPSVFASQIVLPAEANGPTLRDAAQSIRDAAQSIRDAGWESVAIAPLGSKKPIRLCSPSGWVKELLGLPARDYTLTEF